MVRWTIENETAEYFLEDSCYSDIEVICKSDTLLNMNELVNNILNNILEYIENDSRDIAILDFDSMFIMYRYVPKKSVLSARIPYNHPYRGGNNFSKRYYSTQIKKQSWLIYEDPLNSIDLNRITVETFLFNFWKDIISSYPNGQFIKIMFKVRYYAGDTVDNEAPLDVKMFIHKDFLISKSDFIIRSFTNIQSIEHILGIEKKTIKNLLNIIMFNVNKDSENYNELIFKNMYISYQPVHNADYVSIPDGVSHASPHPTIINKSEVISLETKHIKPTMDIETWSEKINFMTDTSAFFIEDGLIYTFILDNYSYTCKVIDSKYNLILKFRDSLSKDVFSQGGLDTFTREIIKIHQNDKEYISKIYYYVNGVKTRSKNIKPGKSLFIINKELEKKKKIKK
jgi:hypothetical protein